MTAVSCPWCQADVPLDPALLEETGDFACPACLTVVRLVDAGVEPDRELDRAA